MCVVRMSLRLNCYFELIERKFKDVLSKVVRAAQQLCPEAYDSLAYRYVHPKNKASCFIFRDLKLTFPATKTDRN